MLLGNFGRGLPVVIVRPSIITSTFQDPVPGWIEGTRTIDVLYVAYKDQKLPCFVADRSAIYDLIPGDIVVSAMMVVITAHWDKHGSQVIYHVTSGHRNPLRCYSLEMSMYHYFQKYPRVTRLGKFVKNTRLLLFKKYGYFHLYMFLRYKVPLEALHVVNVFAGLFSARYEKFNRSYKFLMLLARLYVPYGLFKGCFDDTNMRKLWAAISTRQNDATLFCCDPVIISWDAYLVNTHIRVVLEYAENKNHTKKA